MPTNEQKASAQVAAERPISEPCQHLVRTANADGKTKQCDVCGAIGDIINGDWEPRWRTVPNQSVR